MPKFFLDLNDRFNFERNSYRLNTIKRFLDITDNVHEADYILVLGGDGTLLNHISKYRDLKKPFFPINGGTTGYHMQHLMNKNGDIGVYTVEDIKNNKIFIKKMPTIDVKVVDCSGQNHIFNAFGDAWIERKTPRSLRYNIFIKHDESPLFSDNSDFIDGDGILMATPAGSTGYYRILTNSTIPVGIDCVGVAPMNASIQKKKLGSFVLDKKSELTVSLQDLEFRTPKLILDGIEIEDIIPQEVSLKLSDQEIELAYLDQFFTHEKSLSYLF